MASHKNINHSKAWVGRRYSSNLVWRERIGKIEFACSVMLTELSANGNSIDG